MGKLPDISFYILLVAMFIFNMPCKSLASDKAPPLF